MECNCNNNNSNGGVIPWVRGNRLPLIICVYENVVTQEQVGDSTLTVNEMTRVPYTIQDNDTVTVTFKSGFRQVAMPFTTDGNKVMVTDNGELPKGSYTVEVTIEQGNGARGRWQETRQVRIYENTSDAQLGEMYSIDADLFFYAKGDTGVGIANITTNPDNTLTITMTDGTAYTTTAMKGDKGDKGDTGERGVSIVSFDVTGQTDVSVIYTVTFSDDTTQDISVPKGPQGDTGLTGNGISSTTLNSDYTLTIAYTDGTTYTTPSIRGAQGAQGVSVIGFTQTGETATNTMYNLVFSDGRTQSVAIPKGTKGDKGDTGNTGAQGAQGPKGDTVTATDYTLYNVQGGSSEGAMSQDATTKAISAQTGYYTCGTISGTAEKVVTVESGNVYKRTLGGHFKVKMTNANTAASGVTLQIGSETAAALLYNGVAVSASNTWEEGEVISVYFDGSNYQASNAQGGSNRKIDAYLYEDLRALTVGQIYRKDEIVKTTDKQFLRITKSIEPMTLVDVIAVNDLKVNGSNTYKSKVAINSYNSTTTYSDGQFAIGNPSEISIAVNKGITDGNISVSFGENTPQTIAIVSTDNVSSVVSKICTSLNSIANVGWEFESLGGTIVRATCLTNGDNSQTEFSLTNADSSIITGVTAESSVNSVGDDSTPTILHLTVSIGEGTISVTLGETTNEVEVASTDDSSAIATKIAGKTFSGWAVSSSNNVVTALCNTGGNNSTTAFYITDIDKIGVSSGEKTIVQAGSIGLSVYDSNDGWTSVGISEYAGNSDIWDVVTEEDIITLATEQNNIPKLYDTLGVNTDGALTQKASKEILFNAIDEGLTRERQTYINLKHNDNYSVRYSDGVIVSTASYLKQWVSDYVFLKKGTLITLNNVGVDASYCLLSIYREKDEKSYVRGYKGSGRNVGRSLSYTATEDVYAKISSCYNVNGTSFYMTLTGTEKSDAIFKSITLSAQLFPELYYSNLQFRKRGPSRGNVLCVEGLECVRIKANSTHAVKFALLNDIPSDISNANEVAPNFYIPGEFHVGINDSVLINVEGFKYLYFYGSTDLFPNSFPVTVDYFYKGAHTIAEELDNSFRVEPQPVDIPITVSGYTNLSAYIDVEGAERIKYCLYAAPNFPSYFYDANKKLLGLFGYGDSEGYTTREITLPLGTKYLRYRTKRNDSNTYIKVYYPYITNAQEIEDKINAVDAKLTNAGYHYLAGSYNISTSSEDNSDALQTLVNTINYNGGGIIEMPVGNFKFKKGIIWKSNVSLIGQGQEVTVLEMIGTNSFSLFYGDNVNNISFSDFSVVASSMSASTGGKAMYMRYIEDAVFENLKLVDTQLTSLGIDFLNRVKILNCNVINGGRGRWVAVPSGWGCSGIGIGMGWSGHQENFIISNCICKGCYNNGIFVEDQGRFASGYTVMADGSGQIISNCICRGGRNAGFSIWGGKNVIFANNISYENINAGFEIGYYAIDGTFVGNQSQGNGTGFKIGYIQKASSHIRFTNNEIKGNTTGVNIATAALTNHIVIKDNDLYNNGTAMSISGNSTGLVIRDNNEYGSTTGVTLSGTHTDAIIKGNAFMTTVHSTATFAGETSFVEQLN